MNELSPYSSIEVGIIVVWVTIIRTALNDLMKMDAITVKSEP